MMLYILHHVKLGSYIVNGLFVYQLILKWAELANVKFSFAITKRLN